MIYPKCLNLDRKGSCRVLKVVPCPQQCPSLIEDPELYLVRLYELLSFNERNTQIASSLRKEIAKVCKDHNIKRPQNIDSLKYVDLDKVYKEDQKRGGGGGASEGDANSAASLKQKMKDNRPIECKQTVAQRQQIKDELAAFEAEHGKLEKLSRSPLTRSKTDSYTGDPIK